MARNVSDFYKAFDIFSSNLGNIRIGQHIENFHMALKEAGIDPFYIDDNQYNKLFLEYTTNIVKR